ncbi:hypothetical protein M9H77_25328 [Catharanthus roseus]|uniref:Uncharacterized protein n=1 Tax=Catharanthus roseus TaxID=4058 RepID=A0ACC0A814_CATRO|nr:hypothetical protein M9H77_25328 [Catharanthus roseus]
MSLTSAHPCPGRLWGWNEAFIAIVLCFAIWSAISVIVAASTVAVKLVVGKGAREHCKSTHNPFTNWRVLCSSVSIRRFREPSIEPRALIPPVIPRTPPLGQLRMQYHLGPNPPTVLRPLSTRCRSRVTLPSMSLGRGPRTGD